MFHVLSGLAILIATSLLFWTVLPRNGKCHRLAESFLAPYLSIAFTGGFGIGIAMVLSGLVEMFA